MPLSPLSRLAAVLLAGGCLAALPITFGARQKAAAQAPICEQDLPAATDGRFTLDRSTVQPGDDIVGVLTDFQQWPAGLIGGGSGETFLSCTPWASAESAEVIRNQGAPLVLLAVPPDAVPGTYTVSVVFQEGSTQPSPTDARTARLTASVTVATQAAPTSGGPSPACRLRATAAPLGQLAATALTRPGRPLAVTLTGVPADRLSTMNETDRLWFVACFAGVATPIAHVDEAPTAFQADVPAALAPGSHPLQVFALVDGQVALWEQAITVIVPTTTTTPGGLPPTGTDALATTCAGMLAITVGGLALLAAGRGTGPRRTRPSSQ
jgi:hypothetical protein